MSYRGVFASGNAATDIGRSWIRSANSRVGAMSTSARHRFANELLLSFGRILKVIIVKVSNESVEYLFFFCIILNTLGIFGVGQQQFLLFQYQWKFMILNVILKRYFINDKNQSKLMLTLLIKYQLFHYNQKQTKKCPKFNERRIQ